MTVFQITDMDGEEHACDSKCYGAKHPICNCPCGGKNHGVGLEQAIANTAEMAQQWEAEWEKENGTAGEVFITQYALQQKKGK